MMPLVFFFRVRMGATAAMLAIGFASLIAGGGTANAQDSLVVYGGVGHMKGAWQPVTSKILSATSGEELGFRRSLGIAVEDHARSIRTGWSSLPIVVTSEDAAAAIRSKNSAWTDPFPTMTDLRDHFENVYALVIVPTFEAHFLLDGGDSDVSVQNTFYMVWTTAVLVEPGTGEVKLAAMSYNERQVTWEKGKEPLEELKLTRTIRDQLQRSASEAVDRLATLSRQFGPADSFPAMFTGAIVADKWARQYFRFGAAQPERRRNVCTMPSECENEQCGSVISLLANGIAAELTERNVPVLPPIGLNAWGERATDRIALNLTLPRGAEHLEDEITIAVGADSADRKLVPILGRLRYGSVSKTSQYIVKRPYGAQVRIAGFETDPDDCAAVSGGVQTKNAARERVFDEVEGAPDWPELHQSRLLYLLRETLTKVDYNGLTE